MTKTLSDIEKSVERVERRVVTHRRVDLDAATSVALYAHLVGVGVADLQLSFVPPHAEEFPPDVVILDLSAGFKGEGSCFASLCGLLPEPDRLALQPFAEHVTLQDSGFVWPSPAVAAGTLSYLLTAKREAGALDADLCAWAEEVLEAHLVFGLNRLAEAEENRHALEGATWLADGRVAVLPEGERSGTAFDAGAEFVVFKDAGRFKTGILRARGSSFDLASELGPLLPEPEGWYVDPRGFLVKWIAEHECPLDVSALGELLAGRLSRG